MEYDPSKKEEKMKQVVTGAKISDSKRTKSFFEEDIKNVANDVVHNTLIPSAKTLLYNMLTNALGISLWGADGNPQERRSSNIPRVSYNSPNVYYQSGNRYNYSDNSNLGRGFNYEDITFDTIGDAELVLTSMEDAIERYGCVKVSDLYDLAGITVQNPQTTKYGWTSLRNAKSIKLLGGGFALSLPRPRPID